MAKKKNQSKKHHFKYSQPSTMSVDTEGSQISTVSAGLTTKPAVAIAGNGQVSERDFSYVVSDLKRISVLATCLVLMEVGLAYLFNNTELGAAVNGLIKL